MGRRDSARSRWTRGTVGLGLRYRLTGDIYMVRAADSLVGDVMLVVVVVSIVVVFVVVVIFVLLSAWVVGGRV